MEIEFKILTIVIAFGQFVTAAIVLYTARKDKLRDNETANCNMHRGEIEKKINDVRRDMDFKIEQNRKKSENDIKVIFSKLDNYVFKFEDVIQMQTVLETMREDIKVIKNKIGVV